MADDCVFCKIAQGTIPTKPFYEDDEFVAFQDMHPQAPVHVLLIPRTHYRTILEIEDVGLLGRAMKAIKQVAIGLGVAEDGFRTVLNTGDNGGQTVYHVHWHILGGRFMQWPPG